ncbi:DUF721 domain-containing protein [Cognatishimia sp. MH4019]|uniref:DUF721 domain-containing protein n=1 Tax=Cognatishimia sp. MH4019 TaxID=2854030 RepID=UPI001CD45BB1|nr:DciA family protein [Cognatishimia sp. MH4019]
MAERSGYRKNGTTRGFKSASGLLQSRIRTASQSRGFAETRLLTHWAEIVGAEIAAQAHPVKVGYGRGGIGATLTILTTGAVAPMIEMQKEQIRERVNTCYGYTAISRVLITQTAPTGFSEGQVQFTPAPKAKPGITAEAKARAVQVAGDVKDDGLKQAIETLAGNVLSKAKQ